MGVSVMQRPNFTMAEAAKAESTVNNWISLREKIVAKLKVKNRNQNAKLVRANVKLSGDLSGNDKIATVQLAKSLDANIKRTTSMVAIHQKRIEDLKGKIPYVKALAGAMKLHNEIASIEWRLYIQKGPREKTLAISLRAIAVAQ